MIKLYCISIFLQQEKINGILYICNEHEIGYQEIEITDQVNETEYALIKDDALHGPFFFIFDGHYSNIEPLIRLRCTIGEYDYKLYS